MEIGVIHRSSKRGTSFEARRGSDAAAGEFDVFQLCRYVPCGCRGGSKSANGRSPDGKRVDAVHISRIAHCGLDEAPQGGGAPLVAPTGAKMVDDKRWFSRGVALREVIVVGGACSKVASAFPGMSAREMVDYSAKRLTKYVMENVAAVVVSLESGFLMACPRVSGPNPLVGFTLVSG